MKKSLIFASMAFAGAFALHADWTCQNLFKGIGANPTSESLPSSLDPVNGSWAAFPAGEDPFAGSLELSGGKLVFALEDGEHLDFTVGNADPADTETITDVEVKGVFTPVSATDVTALTAEVMNGRGAQVGFVVEINGAATNYCAWTGGSWVVLTNDAVDAGVNIDDETDLLVRFDYRSNPTNASFAIIGVGVTNFLADASGNVKLPITATAVTAGKVRGVSCYGSGVLAKADGGIGLGVASMDGTKYGSIADAAVAADGAAKDIQVLRAVAGDVALPDGSNVTIYDPNGYVSGEVTVPAGSAVTVAATTEDLGNDITNGVYALHVKVAGAGTMGAILPPEVQEYKEIASTNWDGVSTLTITLQTSDAQISAINPTGTKALTANKTKLREFLAAYTNAAYAAAQATGETMTLALQANGDNGKPLWLSYVLGVNPTEADSLSPVATPVRDDNENYVTLALPKVNPSNYSGDYPEGKVKFYVGSTEQSGSGAILIPHPVSAGSATYDVKVELAD